MKHTITAVRGTTRVVTSLLLLVLMAASVAYIAPSFLGYERYVITGGSMSGTFEKGSVAFEQLVPVEDLRVGDVITYLPPADSGVSTLVTHRITAIDPGEGGTRILTTQGDANADPDPWHFTLLDDTQPVVRTTVPYVGHLFIALADRDVRMIVIGGPAAVIALMALVQLARAVRHPDDSPVHA